MFEPLATASDAVPIPDAAGGNAIIETDAQRSERRRKTDIPAGLWLKCPACGELLHRSIWQENLQVCPACQHHFRTSGRVRVAQLCDELAFEESNADLHASDPLCFFDNKAYAARLGDMRKATGEQDAVITGKAFIKGRPLMLAVMDPSFMMGSMGAVVGEKITRAIEAATEQELPMLIVCCSGGARMQEGALSLQQMAKTSAALARHDDAGGLAITLLTDPTTGGVAASFAMLGDVILAEPRALIGFAGARVIAGTVRQELPPGFQRSEFLLAHGFVDRIVHRAKLRSEIARIIDYCGK
mgnify:CR=1 FL=1